MSDPLEPYELRDPIHGFIQLSQLEWDVINQPVFQRLRRIRQLAWTDMIYPGATHSRFEHSIGVMHVSSRLFDAILRRSKDILQVEYGYDDGELSRQRKIIRLAALFHDLGHGPFSHAGEELLPLKPGTDEKYVHEDYSDAALTYGFADLLDNHDRAKKSGIRIDDVRAVFASGPARARDLVWRDLISGQMDADNHYQISPSFHTNALIKGGQAFLDKNKSEIDKVLGFFGGRKAKDLELVSTIAYLRRHAPKEEFDDDRKLVVHVRALKPKFSEDEIAKAVQEVRRFLAA